MPVQIKYLILIMITTCYITCLSSCKNNIHTITNDLQYKNYLSAKKKLKNNNYKDAIKELEVLNKQHPFSPYSTQIYFDLIYSYYKSMDFSSTHKTINDFIKLNPEHPNLDYPLYIRGLTNMELDNNNIINKLFNLKLSKYNPIYANEAFQDFLQLVHKYPKSLYTMDAYKRLIYLKNRISEHELSVIKYYHAREAYIAVINRSENMLCYFSDTQATHKTLLYMHTAYKKLHLNNQANTLEKIISYNKIQ